MLLKDLVVSSRAALLPLYPENEARSIVAFLAGELLGVESYTHVIEPDRQVSGDCLQTFLSAMSRLEAGEPLQYVLGYSEFCGRRFRVTGDVLIPRPETEMLCDEAVLRAREMQDLRSRAMGCCPSMKEMSRLRVLDLCTGSGCIAWTLALSLPGTRVVGVDISPEALAVAESQAGFLQKTGEALSDMAEASGALLPEFAEYDVLAGPDGLVGEGIPEGFDIIVSNPPYVCDSERSLMHRNVLGHEPHLALFVPDDDPLKFYRSIADFSIKRLIPGGFGIVEINEAFGDAVAAIFSSAGMSKVSILKDFRAKIRFVSFVK